MLFLSSNQLIFGYPRYPCIILGKEKIEYNI